MTPTLSTIRDPLDRAIARSERRTYAPWAARPSLAVAVAGSPVLAVDFAGVTNSYACDALGRRLSATDGRGNATQYAYGPAGDLANVAYSDDTPSVAYTRDRLGRVVRAVVEGVSTNEYAYSLSGLLTNEVQNGVVLLRTYDDFSRATGYVLHDGLLGA